MERDREGKDDDPSYSGEGLGKERKKGLTKHGAVKRGIRKLGSWGGCWMEGRREGTKERKNGIGFNLKDGMGMNGWLNA